MSSTLVSPGVQVTVIDQSQYTSATTGSVPFILMATSQDKINPSGSVAPYTTANTAGQLYLETSQRSLINDFGSPSFKTVGGTPVNADEQNEYGLATAYTALGVSDAVYVMRAPIDLDKLSGTMIPPSGSPANGTIWLDTATTKWGILQYNAALQTFTTVATTNTSGNGKLWVITDSSQTSDYAFSIPLATIGKPGDYAVVTCNINNPVWYLNTEGTWVEVGSIAWQESIPTAIGTVVSPSSITGNLTLNGTNVAISNANLTVAITDINAANIAGVSALSTNNRLGLTVTSSAENGAVIVSGTVATQVGITAGTYYAPAFQASPYTDVPQWNSTDATPAATGSIWFNTTPQESGANIAVYTYNATGNSWVDNTVTIGGNDAAINYALDPIGGGINIPAGTFSLELTTNFQTILMEREAGITSITGTNANTTVLTSNVNTININSSLAGTSQFSGNVAISFSGPNTANLVAAINNANIAGISAELTSQNLVSIKNSVGGTFYLYDDAINTPLGLVGIMPTIEVNNNTETLLFTKVSNWIQPTYVVGGTAPTADPADGTLWYYNDSSAVDIMINTGSAWAGYRTVTADARGYDLTLTDVAGPIISASVPTKQSTGNAVVNGDIWINTSDLNSLPSIYRLTGATGSGANIGGTWTKIDNTDQTSSNGIVFADARWSSTGTANPASATLPTIASLLTSNYLDEDAVSYALYPRGTLLFNTRRSGMNVKQFSSSALTNSDETATWVTASGNNTAGVAYQGSAAQRRMVIKSFISAINNSSQLVEEIYNFNLIACPGYLELLPTLTALNENRGDTSFIVTDCPMTLEPDANTLYNWANNINSATADGIDGIVTYDTYAAAYYSAGLTTDLSGNSIVVPSSYMTIPTIITSDAASYPWFAPAGPTRGLVNNVTSIGYVDAATGEFVANSVSKALRDVLYPAKINPISNISGTGIEIYGQKTRAALVNGEDTKLSRINVARLVIYLKGKLKNIATSYIFEQNDSTTRKDIAEKISQILINIQANRGISDWTVVCDLTNNTSATIDANELYVDVAIAPVSSIEFIYIPLTIVGTGVITSSGVTAS
jgi:hypothetical protein